MLKPEQIQELNPKIKTLQIICLAMISMIVMGSAMMMLVKPVFNQSLEIMTLIGIAISVPCAVASFVVPVISRRGSVNRLAKSAKGDSENRLLHTTFAAFQTSKIIGFATLEGPAFANLLFWMVSGSVFNLAAVVVLLGLMAFNFPATNQSIDRVEEMMNEVQRGNF